MTGLSVGSAPASDVEALLLRLDEGMPSSVGLQIQNW